MERVLTGRGRPHAVRRRHAHHRAVRRDGQLAGRFEDRVGQPEIDHKVAGYKVTLTANNLAWTSNCNCASSGTLSGMVSGGKHDGKSASVTITGCGEADVTIDGDTESVSIDRCMTM